MQDRKYYGLKESNGVYQVILHKSCVKDNINRKSDWHDTKKKAIVFIASILTKKKRKFLFENYKTDKDGYFLNEKLDDLPKSKYYGVRLTQNKKKYYIRIPKTHSLTKNEIKSNFFDEKKASKYLYDHLNGSKKKFLSKKYKKDPNGLFLKEGLLVLRQ